ncbi:MAG: hypothetical protein IJP89_03275 [Synergistaceae bacterium]|nr:hypothetical protein [Synergistaceae bacterium]
MVALTFTLEDCDASTDPFYSPANMERLKKSVAQLNAGKGTEHKLIEAD